MKHWIFFLLISLGSGFSVTAQNQTKALKITGKVKVEKTFSLEQLLRWPMLELGEVNTSCSSKSKEMTPGVKGILLKSVLDSVAFQYPKAKELGSYYFKFVSADGYTLVFSFGEIYNTETGNHLYLITQMNGKQMQDMENGILLLSPTDLRTGSRNMKWLKEIVVCKAD
jgi:hypothetical protein